MKISAEGKAAIVEAGKRCERLMCDASRAEHQGRADDADWNRSIAQLKSAEAFAISEGWMSTRVSA